MTTYEKELVSILEDKYQGMDTGGLVEKLLEMGVVDYTRCKVLAVREYVHALVKAGEKKVDAMWIASERFVCSYEYVRKCMYYYTDVNVA